MSLYKLGQLVKKIFIVFLAAFFVIKSPELHYSYIRSKVQPATVMILNGSMTGGGSGSHIIAPSGKVYILTNAHVCEDKAKSENVNVIDDYGRMIPRRILEISNFTDLCLVESLPNYQNTLKISSEPNPGQIVAAVGHPELMATTMNRGEVIGKMKILVFNRLIEDSSDLCNLPKNKIIEGMSLFGPVKGCFTNIEANATTVPILGGNSGSPLVNFYGELVGVVFASNDANWGFAITISDIENFLRPY